MMSNDVRRILAFLTEDVRTTFAIQLLKISLPYYCKRNVKFTHHVRSSFELLSNSTLHSSTLTVTSGV